MKQLRKVILSITLLVMPFLTFGQMLWSTKAEDADKRVTLEQGIERMLDNYDLYDRYTPDMGYTHEQWLDEIDDDEIKQGWIESFAKISSNNYELYASRRRIEKSFGGTALVVVITYIDAEFVSRVTFSNDIGSEFTYPSDRTKFERWFRTFIDPDAVYSGDKTDAKGDQGNVDARALYGISGGGGGGSLEMAGWMWDSVPDPKETTAQSGKIVFEVIIDDRGNVTSVKAISYSVSANLMRIYQAEVERLTFSRTISGTAPPSSKGKITFIIEAK